MRSIHFGGVAVLLCTVLAASTATAQFSIPLPGGGKVKVRPDGSVSIPGVGTVRSPLPPAAQDGQPAAQRGTGGSAAELARTPANYGPEPPAGTALFEVVPGIDVAITSRYPSGYGPRWGVIQNGASVPFEVDNFVTKQSTSDGPRMTVRFAQLDGRAVMIFSSAINSNCVADIIGTPAVVGTRPVIFRLANFISTGTPPKPNCPLASRRTRSWSGDFSLRTDAEGNLFLTMVLKKYDDQGANSAILTARDLKLANLASARSARWDAGEEMPVVKTDGLTVTQIFQKGQMASATGRNPFARAYFAKGAAMGDVQSMSALAYTYGKDAPARQQDSKKERYWCETAYGGAVRSKIDHELEAVNFFCPQPLVASFAKTQAEKRRNAAAAARADADYKAARAQAEAAARAMISSAIATGMAGGSDGDEDFERDQKVQRDICRQAGTSPC